MAKKYHIDANGKIVPCQAFLRKCPRTDYSSKEAAYSSLYLQEKSNQLAQARAEVERIMSDRNAPSTFIAADFSGQKDNDNARKYANEIERNFLQTGEYPQQVYAHIPLQRSDNSENRIALSLARIPMADYDEGVIKGRWNLETKIKGQRTKVEPMELDFENDYEEEKERAERYIRDVIIRTSPFNIPTENIEYETNQMVQQMEDAFTQIEEEASNPYKVWEKNPDIGTFAGSSMFNIIVDVNYNTTLFRGKTFEKFLNDKDGYFTSVSPDLDIQVYDNENGKSNTSWRIVRHEGEWFLQTVDESGQPNPQKLKNAEDGYQRMHDFVSNHMLTKTPEIAEEKARYVADLMTEVEQAIVTNEKIKDERQGNGSQSVQDSKKKEKHRSLFGESNSTMNNILDLYT